MKTPRLVVISSAIACTAVAVLVTTAPVAATPTILNAWQSRYPTSTIPARTLAAAGSACLMCHRASAFSDPGNCYREALITALSGGATIPQALQAVEPLDSDGDGVINLNEILRPRVGEPGQIGYNPGLIGATGTDPCGAPGAVTNQLETPPACYANCDNSTTPPVLNVSDFSCFLNRFAAGDSYANCDRSTTPPVLNVADFSCFLNAFAAGCS